LPSESSGITVILSKKQWYNAVTPRDPRTTPLILIHDTLQTTFPLSDSVINEAPWQCAPLQHDLL